MRHWTARVGVAFVAIAALALWTVGCDNSSSTTPATSPRADEQAAHDHEGHEHNHEHDAAAIAENLAKLPDEDRAAAEEQKDCPVTDEPLGSMGVPRKVTVEGRDVFLCCEGCEEELKANPEKYLAKLPE